MKLIEVHPDELVVSAELSRSRTAKVFEERLQASIEEMGLAEPLKVAPLPLGKYLVIDGVLRLRAVQRIRTADSSALTSIPAYVVDHERRYELRYQTDIYQDLLPSQLASLVEYLHEAEHVRKVDIARYIGVSPATLRNYTGLWRLIQRGGLFARLVELMDVGVVPASNPYAWLRLEADGLEHVLVVHFARSEEVEAWIDERIARARRGDIAPYPLKYVETVTSDLPSTFYAAPEEVRNLKRDLGLRRAAAVGKSDSVRDTRKAVQYLKTISDLSAEPVLRVAARSLTTYLQ